jgi:hypothetical protein
MDLGEHQVEKDERRNIAAERFESGGPICREVQMESIGFKHMLQWLVERTIIFDDKHSFHRNYLD